ncbi:MAG: TonB-dependent receptor domain-containing protein [Oceanococcus sp.]
MLLKRKSYLLGIFTVFWFGAASAAELSKAAIDAPAPLPNILVTGSRLEQSGAAQSKPVTRIERQAILQSGSRNLAEYLNSLPFMSGAPLGTSVGARGQGGGFSRGIETAELRGLGAQRTLVLLNGRRFVPGGNGVAGVVDLGMLPLALVERIEVLKTGASVEYGADAVAGVINVITRQDLDGIEFRGKTAMSEHGDGQSWDASLVAGGVKQSSHWFAGLQFFDQQSLSKGEREFSSRLLTVNGDDNQVVPDGSSAPIAGNYRTSNGRVTLRAGEDGQQASDFRPFIDTGPNTDRFNFNPFEDLLQDSQRLSAFVATRIAITPAVNYFVEAQWQQRRSDTQLAALPLFSNRLSGVSVAPDNLYNPFAEELSDVRRRVVEAGSREYQQDNQAWRFLAGFEGDWRQWRWDISAAFARNRVEQIQTGELLRDRLQLALGSSFLDSQQQARCGSSGQVIEGCVPLNVFGAEGSIDNTMLAFVSAGAMRDRMMNEQRLINLNASRSLFELPAGAVALAVGYEFRDERAQDTPDVLTQAGNTTGAARAVTRGQFDSHELYLEIGIPLFAGLPGIHSLDLDLGLRLVEFSNFDAEQVYELGLNYQPVTSLTLRAAAAKAFRAPSIGELFGGLRQSNPAVEDPCADFTSLTTQQRDRCVAQGVPADGSFSQSGNETPQLEGGNSTLQAETADSFSAGIHWQPAQWENFSLSLDYYDIEIEDGIAALGANTILAQCIASGAPSFCDRIQRNSRGEITQVTSTLQNIGLETARGVDMELRFKQQFDASTLSHSLLLSRVLQRELIAFAGAQAFLGAGEYDPDRFGAIPRWKGHYDLSWSHQAWSASYQAQWIGSLSERGGEVASGTVRKVPQRIYHDVNLRYLWSGHVAASFGVRNIADTDPPFLANADQANTDVATYRLLGRSLWLSVNWDW